MSLLGEKFVYLFFEFIQNMKKFNFVCMSFFLLIDVSRQLEKECLLLAVRLSQSYISKWSLFLKIIVIIKVYKIISDHFNLSSKFNTKLCIILISEFPRPYSPLMKLVFNFFKLWCHFMCRTHDLLQICLLQKFLLILPALFTVTIKLIFSFRLPWENPR